MNYTNSYKEKSPKETIQIIQNFFNSYNKNFSLFEKSLNQSEIGTWSISLSLQYKGKEFLSTNGKGKTIEFSKASAYAEMYERFCNKIFILSNPFLFNNKKEYFLHSEEKNIFFEDTFNFFNINVNSLYCADLIKENYNLMCNQQYIGIPFLNLSNNQDITYLDPRILINIVNSTGMAAGNTLEEALNQGISEIFERYVASNFFNNKNNITTYYLIDLKKLSLNKYIQTYLQNIENLNYEIYLFDFSYNYNLPVIMAILFDRNNCNFHISFGSFPVFEIALERVLTELYQGIFSYKTILKSTMIPFRNDCSFYNELKARTAYTSAFSFDEKILNIILNKTNLVLPNSNIYVDSTIYNSNKKLNIYLLKLCNLYNYNIYYCNNSLCSDIFALYIIIPELNLMNGTIEILNNEKNLNILLNIYKNSYILLSNNNIDYNLLYKTCYDWEQIRNNIFMDEIICQLLIPKYFCTPFTDLPVVLLLDIFLEILHDNGNYNNYINIINILNSYKLEIFQPLKKIFIIKKYIECNLYSENELIQLSNFLNIDYFKIKNNLYDKNYFINEIFIYFKNTINFFKN